MRRPAAALCVLLPLAACAGAPGAHAVLPAEEPGSLAQVDPPPSEGAWASAEQPVAVVEAAAETPEAPRADAPATGTRLSPEQLAIWNHPEFQRRFVESYLSETEIEPTVTLVEREQMQEVLELMSADRLDEAGALLQGLRAPQASAVIDFTLANVYVQQERPRRAIEALTVAVEKHPKFRRAWQNIGWLYFREGAFEKALPALTRVIELGGGNAIVYGMLGFSYAGLDKQLSSETAYRMAMLLDPETLDWKVGLAQALFKQGRFADACALFGALIDEDPDRPEFWLWQATAFVRLEQPLRALENFEMVDRLGGSTPESLANLGDLYVNQQMFDLGVVAYVRAMSTDPGGSPERALRVARVLIAHQALAEAQALLEGVETHLGARLEDGDRKEALRLRARLALAQGSGDEEARVLEEIVALDPLDGDALVLLGDHSARADDVEQAIFYYERAAALEEFEARAKVQHAQLLVHSSRYAEALPLMRRALALEPRDSLQDYLEQIERIAKSR